METKLEILRKEIDSFNSDYLELINSTLTKLKGLLINSKRSIEKFPKRNEKIDMLIRDVNEMSEVAREALSPIKLKELY